MYRAGTGRPTVSKTEGENLEPRQTLIKQSIEVMSPHTQSMRFQLPQSKRIAVMDLERNYVY
jgi:hypothetical protein